MEGTVPVLLREKGTILYNAAPNFSHVAVIPFPFFSNPTFHNLSNVYKPIDYCILQKCEKISNLEKTAKNAMVRPQIPKYDRIV